MVAQVCAPRFAKVAVEADAQAVAAILVRMVV